MRALVLAALLAVLAGCTSPYQHALDSRQLERPQPYPNAADLRALEPYNNSRYFPN